MSEKEMKVKFSFDTSQFEQGIKKIEQNMRLLDSQTKSSISGFEAFGKSTDSLKAKADGLSGKIDLQKQKIASLNEMYKEAVKEKGSDREATQKLEIKLNNANTSLNKMQIELKSLNAI